MIQQFNEIFSYHAWANAKFRSTLKDIEFEQLKVKTPYGELIERIVHIFVSIDLWLDRIDGKSPKSVKTAKDFRTWKDVSTAWENADKRLKNFIKSLTKESDVNRIIKYESLHGEHYETSINNILIQLMHHQPYHRGQIAQTLREHNLKPIPSNDAIVFFRSPDKKEFLEQ